MTHPFLYPRLYPEEFPNFLSFLTEKDIKVALQYRELDTGALLREFDLRRHLSVKVDSDLVVGHIEDESAFEDILMNKFGIEIEPLQLKHGAVEPHTAVELIGHDFSFNANGKHVLVPVSLPGTVLGASNRRIVVETPQPSVMGLCGGPVLELSKDGLVLPLVVGMVEGRIQNSLANSASAQNIKEGEVEMHKALADKTVLLSSLDIADFITTVEDELDNLAKQESIPAHLLDTPEFTMPSFTAEEAMMPEPTAPEIKMWDPSAQEKDKDIDF